MAGLKVNSLSRKQVAAAVRAIPAGKNFVWDGKDQDDRPLNKAEMLAGMAAAKKRGRPSGSGSKEQVSVRFDLDVLAAFRAYGPGWQTRMNAALKDWLKTHSPA